MSATFDTGKIAQAYAAHGWAVFVLSASKVPVKLCGPRCEEHRSDQAACEACECLQCHGFYAATRDPDRIAEMFRRTPRGCLAVRTGAPSGLVVIDIDPPAGLRTSAILDEGGLLPGTLTAMTGRPLGVHLIYAYPDVKIRQGAGKLGPGVDVKADGGYFIAPPSRHPKTGRHYMWTGDGRFDHPLTPLHPAIVKRLRVEKPPPRRPLPCTTRRAPGRLGHLVQTVLTAPPHEGNNVLLWAACRAGEMVADGAIDRATAETALQAAAEERGSPTNEARATIASGIGRTS